MRQRGLRAGEARDVEGERLGATGPHQPLEPDREVVLGHARTDLGQERRERAVGDRTGRSDALELGRLLGGAIRLDPALDGDQLDVRGRGRQSLPGRVRDDDGLDGDTPHPDRGEHLRPPRREVVVHVDDPGVGRFAMGLDVVARVGQHEEVLAADQELARGAGDLLLAVAQRNPVR